MLSSLRKIGSLLYSRSLASLENCSSFRVCSISLTYLIFSRLTRCLGSDLVDISYYPLFPGTSRSVAPFTVIPAAHVTSESGTGLVHCAPAHGAEDYASFRALGLLKAENPASLICHVDGEGRYGHGVIDAVGPACGMRLQGLDVLVRGTNLVIEMLKEMDGVLMKEERITHRYPYDWKTDKPIIVTSVLFVRSFV